MWCNDDWLPVCVGTELFRGYQLRIEVNNVEITNGLAKKYKREIIYIVVGIATTAINFIIYYIVSKLLGIHYLASNIIAWVIAVLFAYIANRLWVFNSKNTQIIAEITSFILSRLFSLALESGLLFLAVDTLAINSVISKLIVALVVVITNYLTGKLLVFKGGGA